MTTRRARREGFWGLGGSGVLVALLLVLELYEPEPAPPPGATGATPVELASAERRSDRTGGWVERAGRRYR